jgi:3-oxoacyl-[acyl-carrier protein] reductase
VDQSGEPTTPRAARPLEGRVALVTGASRRIAIGAGIARRLAADGAAVMLHSWSPHDAEQPWGADPEGAEPILAEIRAAGGRAEHVAADLADPEAPARLVEAARRTFGQVDVLIANHARSGAQSLEQLTAGELDLCHAVNTRATLLLAQAFAAQHDGRRGGRILFFTSGQYHDAMPAELPYIASKGALHQLTRSVAVHLMPHGITVNCVNPGPNDTGYADDATRAAVAAANPGGRWGTPADAARLVAWLVSDEADWVTGQVIASDGGWSAR